MRILLVNKFNYARGGADAYFLFLQKALVAAGHTVAIFAMDHPKNETSPWQRYFVSRVSFNTTGLLGRLKAAGRIFYSFEAARKFKRLLADFRPDIVHCHNIYHHLSPAILTVAKKRGIPIILHLHDYKLISPNYRLFARGRIWRASLDEKSYWACVRDNCLESYPRSILAYLEMTFHHKIGKFYEKNIDLLIAPSRFMADLVRESGWPKENIITLINCVPALKNPEPEQSVGPGNYFLYFGRLSPEKGIEDLVAAARSLDVKLHLVGSGPSEVALKEMCRAEIKAGQISFLGQLGGQRLRSEINGATAVVIPSCWYENMPLVLLEALALGRIVIASRIGGMPEIIQAGRNGFLFEAGNVADLSARMSSVRELPAATIKNIKDEALKTAAALAPESHLRQLLNIYEGLLKNKQ